MGNLNEEPHQKSRKGMKIVFRDLEYAVASNVKKGTKISLLKNVTGYFNPGQMAALMGPSGSGKTTLLDVLAGRKTQGEITGTIEFASHKPTVTFLRRYTGYVEQFDTLLAIFTVYEMLLYTAELKRKESESIVSKKAAVEELIARLALESCRNTRIGNDMNRGISGGQSKRVNIGIALITNPRVLFLDEPTSGLDSYTSNEVMTVVKSLTQDGRTICATIHSPSPLTFSLFDRIILLLRGKVVFFGERSEAVAYFEALAPESTVSLNNEAEWLTDIIVKADRNNKVEELALKYQQSALKKVSDEHIEKLHNMVEEVDDETMKQLSARRDTMTHFHHALRVLLQYRTLKNYRDPEFLGSRIGDKIMFCFIIATLYLGIGDDFTDENAYNMAAVLFMSCTLPAFGAASYVPSITLERGLFYRERNDGLYRVITYLVAKMIEELLLAAVISLILGAAVWSVTKFALDFWVYWLVYFGTLANGIVLAFLVATIAPTIDVANAALPAYTVTLLFFAGLLIRKDDIPNYWKWYSSIDFLYYSWGSLMINQFDREEANGIYFIENGRKVTVLEFYSLDVSDQSKYIGIIYLFFAVFFLLAFLAMTFVRYQKR